MLTRYWQAECVLIETVLTYATCSTYHTLVRSLQLLKYLHCVSYMKGGSLLWQYYFKVNSIFMLSTKIRMYHCNSMTHFQNIIWAHFIFLSHLFVKFHNDQVCSISAFRPNITFTYEALFTNLNFKNVISIQNVMSIFLCLRLYQKILTSGEGDLWIQ
jgi:hypothetical protein